MLRTGDRRRGKTGTAGKRRRQPTGTSGQTRPAATNGAASRAGRSKAAGHQTGGRDGADVERGAARDRGAGAKTRPGEPGRRSQKRETHQRHTGAQSGPRRARREDARG